jgi:hypothetical protein
VKLGLVLPKYFSDASLPKISPNRGGLRFPAHDDPDRGSFLCRSLAVSLADPQIKVFPTSELPSLDETFEGCLPADALIRAEPFLWLQRLYLGQLFPALFSASRKDFPSSGGTRAGKKAVLVTTFSLGRLVCSFHEAWIIVKIVCNIQRFVLASEIFSSFFSPFFSSKKIFIVRRQKIFLL